MVDEDTLVKVLRIQSLAMLLSLDLPISVRKRIVYELLNSLGMKLNEDELRELEAMYTPPTFVAKGKAKHTSVAEMKEHHIMRHLAERGTSEKA